MNYKKLILVGLISAFVAVLTSVLGVAGTIIGSVISSVLYNMLSEALEKPVSNASFNHDFEWDVAYVFPLAVIALIQLLLIFALLSEYGVLPYTFANVYLSIQNLANNNLYRLLGVAVLIISAYPLVLKPEFVKKEHGIILVFVGLIFLARGFVDVGNSITQVYDGIFRYFDLPIAIVAFLLLVFVIARILIFAKKSDSNVKNTKNTFDPNNVRRVKNTKKSKKVQNSNARSRGDIRVKDNPKKSPVHNNHGDSQKTKTQSDVKFGREVDEQNQARINKSSDNIHFESNDLLDDYKK